MFSDIKHWLSRGILSKFSCLSSCLLSGVTNEWKVLDHQNYHQSNIQHSQYCFRQHLNRLFFRNIIWRSAFCGFVVNQIIRYQLSFIPYTVTDGKVKTPLYVMAGQYVYSRCCSRSTIKSLNKIGISTNYDCVERGRALIALYAVKKSQNS